MTIINNIEEYDRIRIKYSVVEEIYMIRNVDYNSIDPYDIEIVLCNILPNTVERLHLNCKGAFDIEIKKPQYMSGVLIEISNIRSHQIEGALYRVMDIEEDSISFYCASFSAEII